MLDVLRKNKNKIFLTKLLFLFMAVNLFEGVAFAASAQEAPIKSTHKQVGKDSDVSDYSSRSVYAKLADMYLPSLSKKEEAEFEMLQEIAGRNENAAEKKDTSLLVVPPIGEIEKLRLTYSLFDADSVEKEDFLNSQKAVIDTSVFSDLDIFCGQDENLEKTMLSQINYTRTVFGTVEFQKFFYPRYKDVKEFQQQTRRKANIVAYLLAHPDVVEKIKEYLNIIKAGENDLMWFFKGADEYVQNYFNSVYFTAFGGEENTLVQGLSAEWTRFINPGMWITGLWPILGVTLFYDILIGICSHFACSMLNKFIDAPDANLNMFKELKGDDLNAAIEQLKQADPTVKIFFESINDKDNEWMFNLLLKKANFEQLKDLKNIKTGDDLLNMFYSETSMLGNLARIGRMDAALFKKIFLPLGIPTINLPYKGIKASWEHKEFLKGAFTKAKENPAPFVATGITLGIFAAIIISVLYFAFWRPAKRSFSKLNHITNLMQGKLINVASLSNAATKLGMLIRSNPELSGLFGDVGNLQFADDKEVNSLFKDLTTDTFKGNPSFWSNKAKVMTTFKKMYRLKEGFVGKLKGVGELDAYISIVELVKKHEENENASYCVVNVVDSDKPFINCIGGWHPRIDPKKVVPNDFTLGFSPLPLDNDNFAPNMILTGPNACGKSVYTRLIVLALIFAIALGVAPAKKFDFSIFSKIATYLNIADTVGKDSLFQAELSQAEELLNMAWQLLNDEFMLAVIDEPFTGTNPEEASTAAVEFAKAFPSNNVIRIIATHYKKLTELEAQTNGLFKNYKVFVEPLADGTYKRTFKIIPGISQQQIATEMVKQKLGQFFGGANSATPPQEIFAQ